MKVIVPYLRKAIPYEYGLWLILVITFSSMFVSFTVDDAFISFRYAYNLVHYGIWNFNPDHEYVEAYTSSLYTFLAILPHWVGISPVVFFKILGFFLLLRLIWRLHSLCADRWTRFVFTFFILGNVYTYIHIYSCLETPLFMALCVELFAWLVENKPDPRKFYCLLLLLPLTRPDGGLLSAFALGYYGWRTKAHITHPKFLASVITLGVTYFMWRYWYFGYLLPNTFYAKRLEAFTMDSVIIKLAGIVFYLMAVSTLILWIKERDFRFCAFSVLAIYAVAYLPCASWMNYADRFAFQLFIPAIVISAHYVQHFSGKRRLGVCMVLLPLLLVIDCDREAMSFSHNYSHTNNYTNVILGEALAEFRPKGYTLMTSDVGALPYYSGWKTYDALGLADVTIARQGNSITYMQKIQPDLVLINVNTKDVASLEEHPERSMLKDFNQAEIYHYVQSSGLYQRVSLLTYSESYHYIVFIKKNLPDYVPLQQIAMRVAVISKQMNSQSSPLFPGFGYLE